MPQTIRHLLAATGLAAVTFTALAGPAAVLSTAPALAQGEAPQQIALTQKQIDGLVAAQPEIAAVPQTGDPEKPDPKMQAKVEAIVKKNGFTSLDTYGEVADSVSAVLAGMDPEKKTYVGQSAIIKQQISEVQADKSMKAQDKAEALKELKAAFAAGDGPKPPAGNVELVAKNYDKLARVMQGGGNGNGQ